MALLQSQLGLAAPPPQMMVPAVAAPRLDLPTEKGLGCVTAVPPPLQAAELPLATLARGQDAPPVCVQQDRVAGLDAIVSIPSPLTLALMLRPLYFSIQSQI